MHYTVSKEKNTDVIHTTCSYPQTSVEVTCKCTADQKNCSSSASFFPGASLSR